MKRRNVLVALWVIVLSIALAVVLLNQFPAGTAVAKSVAYEELKLFTEILSVVKRNYVEEVETKEIVYGAIRGMLRSLDPHSGFMPPEAYKEMQIDTKGEFGGLGIQIGIRDGVLTVIAPIEDTPAWRAGVKAGDMIIKVNGEATKDMTLMDAVSKMRGPKGTDVIITIMREGWEAFKDFTITRDRIKLKSIKSRIIDEDVGYVKISQFQERTATDLAKALKDLNEKKITSLVLDLRNNPGGLLDSAVDVADQFLPTSKLVVYTMGRSGSKLEYLTKGKHPHYAWPMVVLLNHGSASASEIVAGAIKDWNRGVLLGRKTFGKGSVQSVMPLSGGAGLRLTTAKYYTPDGVSIQNTGIEPDIKVEIKAANGKTHQVVREKDLDNHLSNDNAPVKKEDRKEFAPQVIDEKDDIQLQRAVDLLKGLKIFNDVSARKAG